MKKLFKNFAAALVAVGLLGIAFNAQAQQSIPVKTYPLTNAVFSIANGATNIAGSGSITLNSPWVQVWRGRGFTLHAGIYGTNAGTDAVTFTLQTATPYTIGGVTYTNVGSPTTNYSVAMNGTTEVYGAMLVPPTAIDNVTWVRVTTVANAHASTVWLDPTNTFISVFP